MVATLPFWLGAIHADANIDVDARNPSLVPCFSLVSAEAFAVYRLDPHVVVLCPSALGCRVVAFLPRVLVLIFIHAHRGFDLWFWIHLVTAILVWSGSGVSHKNRRIQEKAYLEHSCPP